MANKEDLDTITELIESNELQERNMKRKITETNEGDIG